MPKSPCYKSITVAPLTGPTDCRSPVEDVGFGAYRVVQNMTTTAANKVCRRPGWEKFLTQEPYNNQDLHDQLLQQQYYYTGYELFNTDYCWPELYARGNGRQPITFQFEFISSLGSRRFVAGTQTRLYSLNESTGNWRILADGYGGPHSTCSSVRFKGAQLGDFLVVTNDYDEPAFWIFDDPLDPCNLNAFQPIPDLQEIGLTKAYAITEFKGFMFLGNVEMDGGRFSSRIVWCDFNDPLSWVPATGSFAGYQDLPYSEVIQGMAVMRDYLIIYTDKGIWRAVYTGNLDAPFTFENLYTEPVSGDGCLVYPNTLITVGDTHYYLSHEGPYEFSLFTPKPIRDEWLHRSACVIYDDLKDRCCEHVVSGYNPLTKEWWVSWPQANASTCCPTVTRCFNIQYRTSDTIDHGFTSFGNYRSDSRDDIRAFLLENCVCTPEELTNLSSVIEKEGPGLAATGCDSSVTSLWNETEDTTLPQAAGSLCASLGATRVEDLCQDCLASPVFVLASATDYCLKQYGTAYNRERYTGYGGAPSCSGTTSGDYCIDGYTSILQSGALSFGKPEELKEIRRFEVEYWAADQTVPSDLNLRIGYADQATCSPRWKAQSTKKLDCLTLSTEEAHITAGTRAAITAEWPLFYEGRYLYWEIYITGTGGSSCFSRATFEVRVLPRE